MKKWLILLLTALLLLSVAACGKGGKGNDSEPPENAVLTDSDVPLDLGAQVWDFSETQTAQ